MRLVSNIALMLTITGSAAFAEPFPMAVFNRPFTMPTNSFESTLSFSNKNIGELGLNYGINDYVEAGISWSGVGTGDLKPSRTDTLSLNINNHVFATYRVAAMSKFSLPVYYMASNMHFRELSWGMPTYIALYKGKVNLVLAENLLTLGWLDSFEAQFKFSTRLSWQATHALCVNLSTSLGTLSTLGLNKHIGEAAPVTLSALYAITPLFDVFASAGVKSVQAVKNYDSFATNAAFMFGLNFRGGSVDG